MTTTVLPTRFENFIAQLKVAASTSGLDKVLEITSDFLIAQEARTIELLKDAEPMDLGLARAMCRSAGISLVSRDFIERFADFVMDWKKGDFTLPKYAEIDMQSCFDAWQAFDPDLATPKPITASDVTDDMAFRFMGNEDAKQPEDKEFVRKVANSYKFAIAAAVNAFNGVKP